MKKKLNFKNIKLLAGVMGTTISSGFLFLMLLHKFVGEDITMSATATLFSLLATVFTVLVLENKEKEQNA